MGTGKHGLPQGSHLCWLLCAFILKLSQAEALMWAEKLLVSTSNLLCWLLRKNMLHVLIFRLNPPKCVSTGYGEKVIYLRGMNSKAAAQL
uniref:Secreted protein n=3 Tax=Canis lupus TaxID=9612 RepID=A0A8C0TET1_CANLF